MDVIQKTFVLGLGAQKAATSWLYHYLNADETADFGGLKEYRVWDALELREMSHFDVRPNRLFNRSVIMLTSTLKKRGPNGWRLRGQLQRKPSHYFDYFETLLAQPGIHMTGDITPTYSGLSQQTLMMLRDEFARRGIAVQPFFIMRDPINRAVSAAKMNRRKRDWRENVPQLVGLDKAVLSYVQSPMHELVANYERTVEGARAVFGTDATIFGFYENMFDLERLERLSIRMGVTYRPERIKTRFYSSETSSLGITPQTEAALREILDPTYHYMAREFPETLDLWRH